MIDTPKITLLFGKICSGKSTYADALCYVTKAKRITVSDIVKRLSGMTSRSQLSTTADLDESIAIELCKEIKRYDKVVIDGIRQYSIVFELVLEFGRDEIEMIWLEVPDEVRRHRFYDRAIAKDDMTFEMSNELDDKLGLADLQEKLKDVYTIVNN